MTVPYGVYAGKDIEVVYTEKYMIVYRRYPDKRRLESLLLNHKLECLGICRTTPAGMPKLILDLLDKEIHTITQQDHAFLFVFEDGTTNRIPGAPPENIKSALLCKQVRRLSQKGDSIVIHYRDGGEYSFIPPGDNIWEYASLTEGGKNIIASNDNMKEMIGRQPLAVAADGEKSLLVTFGDGTTYPAKAHELFTMDDLNPRRPLLGEAGIGECLLTWHIGCREILIDDRFNVVTINTWKHMYIFEITQNSIYCRAARYAACDKGVVFDQNFRQGNEAYMIEDNRAAMYDLEYDESLFGTDACVWNGKSVYWSVASVSASEIELHGCQGDIYKWTRPEE